MVADFDFEWQDYASCKEIDDINIFFDDYESDVVTAINVDEVCIHCPVARRCLEYGMDMGSWGVHGGMYLVYGKIDQAKNSHKNPETWRRLETVHGRRFDTEHQRDNQNV